MKRHPIRAKAKAFGRRIFAQWFILAAILYVTSLFQLSLASFALERHALTQFLVPFGCGVLFSGWFVVMAWVALRQARGAEKAFAVGLYKLYWNRMEKGKSQLESQESNQGNV